MGGIVYNNYLWILLSAIFRGRLLVFYLHGVVGFNEEPVDEGSYGPSHHGCYNRHPPPVMNTALRASAR